MILFLKPPNCGTFPIAVLLALQSIVDGGQGNVGLGETWEILDQLFQLHSRSFVLCLKDVDRGALVQCSGVVWMDSQGMFQANQGLVEFAVLLEQQACLDVGDVVVRVELQLLPKLFRRPIGIARLF